MKKVILLLLLCSAFFSYSEQANAAVVARPYGTIGGTVVDLPGAQHWNTMRSGGGLQGLYEISPDIKFGLDIAYMYSYYYEIVYGYSVEYVNVLALAEYHYGVAMLQAGLGPYIGTGYNDDSPMGIMLGCGVDLPVTETLSATMMARFDLVFNNFYKGDDVTFMPCFMAGLAIKF